MPKQQMPGEDLKKFAQNMGKHPVENEKFQSTYARLIIGMEQMEIEQTTGKKIEDGPLLRSMALLKKDSANTRIQIQDINTRETTQLASNLNESTAIMSSDRSTNALSSQYKQECLPLTNEAAERQVEKENLEDSIFAYIKDMKMKTIKIVNTLYEKEKDKLKSEITHTLDDLKKQGSSLKAKAEKLNINVQALQKKMKRLSAEMKKILPREKKAIQPTPRIESS